MSTAQLFIPKRINVGYKEREGTYTGKLAFIIYYDHKGVLRKEQSWNGWRDQTIPNVEFDNTPTSGFVLNKGVGGKRESYSWNPRNEYIRIYDPRDFEFEISVANLLFILKECNCSKGKGLEGNFVYGWDGTELVLLPEKCEDFKKSQKFTDSIAAGGLKVKDLILGATYTRKNASRNLIYIGKYDYFFMVEPQNYRFNKKDITGKSKKFVFWDSNDEKFEVFDSVSALTLISNSIADYATFIEKYYKSSHGSPVAKIFLKEEQKEEKKHYNRNLFGYEENGEFFACEVKRDRDDNITYYRVFSKYNIDNGVFKETRLKQYAINPKFRNQVMDEFNRENRFYSRTNTALEYITWKEPTTHQIYVQLESGSKFEASDITLSKGY